MTQNKKSGLTITAIIAILGIIVTVGIFWHNSEKCQNDSIAAYAEKIKHLESIVPKIDSIQDDIIQVRLDLIKIKTILRPGGDIDVAIDLDMDEFSKFIDLAQKKQPAL